MQINEIFSSIDGEGIRTGYLVTFIRTQFCIKPFCSYCDTKYSLYPYDENGNKQYKNMTVEEIIDKCVKLGNKRITITGGEPLIQLDIMDLINGLTSKGYEVNIETNGAIDLLPFIQLLENQHKIIFTMDWKCPYSNMRNKMIPHNLQLLDNKDVLKFVVGTQEDLEEMCNIVKYNKLDCNIFISPVFGKIEPKEIVEYIKLHNLQEVRVQLQLHKLIWEPDKRGV